MKGSQGRNIISFRLAFQIFLSIKYLRTLIKLRITKLGVPEVLSEVGSADRKTMGLTFHSNLYCIHLQPI